MKFVGLNLTVPHKLLALGMVDVLDETTRNWGAVNTIRFEGRAANGEWVSLGQGNFEQTAEIRSHGFNTDADAIIRVLDRSYIDLTSPIGRGFMAFISAMAEDERQRIIKRTHEGRVIARENGVKMGRKHSVNTAGAVLFTQLGC